MALGKAYAWKIGMPQKMIVSDIFALQRETNDLSLQIVIIKSYYNMVWFMVFNAIFNNISVISWRSVLLVEKTNNLTQISDEHYHMKLYRVHLALNGIRTHNVSGDRY